VPPKISPFNFGADNQEGQRVQVMCTSSVGDHPFNITWYKDYKQLHQAQSKNHHHHEFDDRTVEITEIPPFSSILTIHNITSHHNGNYTCIISNTAGSVEHSAILSVAGNYHQYYLPPHYLNKSHYTCTTITNNHLIVIYFLLLWALLITICNNQLLCCMCFRALFDYSEIRVSMHAFFVFLLFLSVRIDNCFFIDFGRGLEVTIVMKICRSMIYSIVLYLKILDFGKVFFKNHEEIMEFLVRGWKLTKLQTFDSKMAQNASFS
jgi:hypothetical protein